MNIEVNEHEVIVKQPPINEQELNISKCYFEFAEAITEEYTKKALFTFDGNTYMQYIINNECDIPNEVLAHKGDVELGVVATLIENEEEIKRYNPTPGYFTTWLGSLKEYENSEPITPTDKEQMEQAITDIEAEMNNLNIDGSKSGKITTITITFKDGTTKDLTLEDGKSIEYNWQGTQLGIRQEGESDYTYVDLKGDKGEAGAIKFEIVAELPTTGIQEDTIYLVPITPDIEGNNYEEYIYVNGQWELLGKIGVQVDLTGYYTKQETDTLLSNKVGFTDYATGSNSGVLKVNSNYGVYLDSGVLKGNGKTYSAYGSDGGSLIISKSTLENVITGKGLTTKSYVDGLVGDIQTLLDNLDSGNGV